MCCVCCVGYFSLVRPGIGTRWVQEPSPPVPLTRLELGTAGEVLGFTPDGGMYEFSYGNYQTESSWDKVEQPSGTAPIGNHCSSETEKRIIISPPGDVVSRISESCTYIESGYQFEMVLLENGEIWSWKHETYAYAMLFIMFMVFIGLIVGLAITMAGTGIWIFQKIKERRNSQGTLEA